MFSEKLSANKKKAYYAAIELFHTKGYGGTSMREIAKAVGIKHNALRPF